MGNKYVTDMLTRMSRLVGMPRAGGRSPQRGCAGYAASARRGLGVARWLLFLAVGVGLWGAASGQTNPWLENIKPGTSLPVGKTDSHGNYLVVKAYRGFEESEYPEKTSDYRIDAGGWTMESKNFSIAKWILWEGGSGPANGSIHYPSGAKVGKHNALNAFFGSGRQTYLVTPPTNVGSREVSDPALYFWFAAMANQNQPDELQIFVRNKRAKDANRREFKTPIAIFRNEGEGGWVEVQVKLNDAFKGWSEEDKQSVQFGFLAIGNNGWGICLDELMLIDLGGKPAQVSNVGMSQLIQPLGQDSKLNEIFRVDIGVGTGSGKYKIKEFKLEFDGAPEVYERSVEHLYLYHSKLPTFDSHAENRMATITMQGGKVTNIAWEKRGSDQHEDRFLEPGQRHYLWLVADIKSNAQPKDVLRFKAPRSAIELVYCDNRGEENPKVGSKIYPIEQEWTAGEERKCTIYKTLFSDSFENGAGNWTLASDWKVGEICATHHSFGSDKLSQHPSRAFGGTGVLATAKMGDASGACAGKIQPMYSPNLSEQSCTAVKANIDASIYRNVLVRFRYAASLGGSNDRVSLFVKSAAYGDQKVWLENSGVRDTGWKTAVVEIRDYADRVQNLTLGFAIKSDAVDENAGLLIDDFQVLGDYIKADVGVENILPPTTLEFDANSKITVRVKNYGAEAVDASKVTVTVKVNGEEMVLPGKMGSIAAGATLDWEFSSNRLVPVTNRNNEIVVEATAKIPDDDGTDNDTKRVRFYSFPKFEVSATKPWPENTDIRMDQWYPTTYPGGGASSWLQSFKELCSKCASGRMFSADPPVNKFIWTTGNERNNTHENSVLTGPIFDLKADANVKYEVVVTHMLSERAKMWIEYRTDVNAPSASTEGWTTLLPPTGGWSENWYGGTANAWVGTSSTSPGPEPMPVPYSYKVSKTMLPVQSGKVQLRVRFNDPDNAEANEGAAVNMIRVQALKADLQVTGFTPQPQCTNTPSSTPLKIKVKNNGPVAQKSFMCPVHVVVREMQERTRGTRAPELPVPGDVVLVDKILTLQIPDINVGEEKEIDTELAFAWDWADWGYFIEIAMNMEQSSQGSDENTANNSYSGSYIPKMYPGLFFAEADPATRQIAVPSQIGPNTPVTLYQRNRRAWANHMNDNLELGTAQGYRNAREGVFYSFTSDGTFKIKFKYSYGVNVEGTCPETTEEYTLVKNDVRLSLGQVDVKQNSCYSPGGETVGVPISGAPGTEVKAIIYINGDYAHPAASAEGAIPASDKSVTLSLTGVKIPANYSTVEVVALVKKGSSYLPSQGTEGHRVISKVYRWKTPNRLPVYVRTRTGNPGSYTYSNQMLLPYEGAVVNNFTTAKLELYTPAEDGVKYTWIRTRNGVSETIEGNSIYLEEYDASYSVKAESKECGSPIASNQIKVWSGDIELVAFTGVTALEGVCQSASGGTQLSIDLENHSRTLYKAGLPVKFVMTYPDASTENIDIKLPKDLQEQARITIPLPEIPKGKLRIGHNTLKLEFKQIGESADGDGDKSNNTIEGDINLKPSPEVEFEDAAKPDGVIRQKIDRWVFSPKIKSKDGTTYNWTGRMVDDELQAWSASLGRQSTLTVEGTPKYDLYKIAVKNAEGCTTEKIYKLIMTDASLKRIERPFSSCSLGEDNTDVVVVIIGNEGKRPLQKDTEVTVTVKLSDGTTYTADKEQLDNDIPEGGDYKIIIPAEGLQKKLAGVQNMRLTAEVKLGNLNGKKVEDIEKSNDKVTTEIYSYGYPKFSVKYVPISQCNPNAESYPLEGKDLRVKWPYAKFVVENLEGSNTVEFLYGSNSLDPAMVIEDGNKPPDNPSGASLPDQQSYLPTKSTMEKSEDRAGKGHYVIRARNSEGCEADVKFDLVLERYALELVGSQSTSPRAQCQFPDEKLETQVVVKNTGNTKLPEGTKLKFTAILNDDTKNQGSTDEYEVEAAKNAGRLEESEAVLKGELPPNYSFPFTIKLPKLNVGRDGQELRIQVKVAFGDETGLQCANLAGSEAVGILKTQDKKDVGTFDITITPAGGAKETKNLEKRTYSDPFEYEVDYVALDVQNQGTEEFTYQWSWDGGIGLKYGSGRRTDDKAQGIDVEGSGRVACRLTNKTSGCSRESGGYIRRKGLNLAVKWIVSPRSTCKPNVPEAIPVKVWVANVGSNDFVVEKEKDAQKAFTIKYAVYKKGETTNPLSEGSKDVMFKDLFTLNNDDPGDLHNGMVGLRAIKISNEQGKVSDTTESIRDFDLPDITGMKGLRETDFYIQAELLDISPDVEGSAGIPKHVTKKEFQHYASPTIAGEKLGGAKEVFYSATGVIKVTDEGEEGLYHNYQWSKVGGGTLQTGESSGLAGATPSSAVVTEPGDYMLTFVDANQCAGSASKTVRFPAYLVFADSDLVLPEKEACALTADEEVAVKVTNMGKEPYTPPSGGVPVNVECTEYNSDFATLSTDLDKKQHLEGARLQLMDAPLAPGATGVMKGKITTTDGKHLSLASEEGQMKFQIMVKIRDEADSSQLVTPPAKRPKREVKTGDVMNYSHPLLGKPLDEMAKDGLQDPSADLMRIPFAKRGFIMSPTGLSIETVPTWYYTAQGVADTPIEGRELKVMRTGEYMLKLMEKHGNQTCQSTYGPIKLRFKPEYVLTPEFDQSSTTQCREEKDKNVGLESPIAIKLKVAPRVVPIAAGDKFTVSYEEENVAGSLHEEELVVENTIDTTAADAPTVLEYSFQIKPRFKAGNHKIKVKVLYKDDLGDPTPGEVLEELHFNIKPAFDFNATFTTENPPITIVGPEPPAGDSYTYWWSVNSGTGSSAIHDRSGEYFLKVTSNGCTTEKTFLVRIMRKVSWEVENPDMGTFKVELLKRDSEEVERELNNPDAVSGEAELLITALPNKGHILNLLERQGVEIAGAEAGGFKGKIPVDDKPVELKVGFAQGPDPHAVGVLPEVRIVSPFSRSLELLNTERVVEFEVVNQVGAVITHQHIAAGQPRITLEFPNLPEGLYLVRVVDAAGGVRTLRAVKAH